MTTYAWLSDTHFNCVTDDVFDDLCTSIQMSDAQAIILTGDIAESHDVDLWLKRLTHGLQMPVYFVLGNHDYYYSSLSQVNQKIKNLCEQESDLYWLDHHAPILLNDTHVLLGVGGWGDARCGDFLHTPVRLNDHRLITDFVNLEREQLQIKLQKLGSEMADRLKDKLSWVSSQKQITNVLVATHVPPFIESCWHLGQTGAIDWIADFVCVAVGRVLKDFCDLNPRIQCQVLCGHSHSRGQAMISANLNILTAYAHYRAPQVEMFLNL